MTDSQPTRGASFLWAPALIVAVTAFAVVAPMLFLGNPSGHDFEFHLNSWMEVLGQWKQGIFYPRWASMAHYGYGEARFLFYPPASWTLGALLGAALPWVIVPGVYIWIVLTGSGAAMFHVARRWLSRTDAIFAAAFYAANPYHIVIVYWRSAFAELLASALLPWLLLLVLRDETAEHRRVLPLALVLAAAWLANAPAAVMVNYSLALLVVVTAIARWEPRLLLSGAAAVALGAALAAFYVLPAAYEEKWVNLAEVLAPGVRPQDNFLFTTMGDPDHNRFNLLVSCVAAAEMVLLAGLVLLSRSWCRRQPAFWWSTVAWAASATLLMFSFTLVFWEHLPKLRFVQLPWRWLLCMNAALALLLTLGMRRWLSRLLMCAVMLSVLLVVWPRVQPPWWDNAADIAEMRDNFEEDRGYEGTDEYVPAGVDPYEISQDARKVTVQGGGKTRIHVQQWAPESKFLTADVTRPARLVLRLFNYPAWKAEVNDRIVDAKTQELTGQITIPVKAGENYVRITFVRTWDRTLGAVISAVSAVFVIGLAVARKKHSLRAPAS